MFFAIVAIPQDGGEQGNRVWASSANAMCELLADCSEVGKEMFRCDFVRRGLSINALTPSQNGALAYGPHVSAVYITSAIKHELLLVVLNRHTGALTVH
jgi:hypothetical protein